jgi:hypothetical protein
MSHLPLWIAAGLIFLGVVLLVVGLCQMAAMGDRRLEQARRDLAGPRDRDRLGL